MNDSKSIEDIHADLNSPETLLWEIPLETAQTFLDYLKSLKDINIILLGEKNLPGTEVIYSFAEVNQDLSERSEAKLAISMLSKLHILLEMSTILISVYKYV